MKVMEKITANRRNMTAGVGYVCFMSISNKIKPPKTVCMSHSGSFQDMVLVSSISLTLFTINKKKAELCQRSSSVTYRDLRGAFTIWI